MLFRSEEEREQGDVARVSLGEARQVAEVKQSHAGRDGVRAAAEASTWPATRMIEHRARVKRNERVYYRGYIRSLWHGVLWPDDRLPTTQHAESEL